MENIFIPLSISCLILHGISQIIGKLDLKRVLFCLCLFLTAYIQFYFHLVYTKDLLKYEHLFTSYIPCLLFLGPVSRSYFKLLTQDRSSKILSSLIHFLLPSASLFYYAQYYTLPKIELKSLIENSYLGINIELYIPASIICGLSLFFYSIIILKEQPKILNRDSWLNKPLILGWWLINTLFILLMTLSLANMTISLKLSFFSNYFASLFFITVFVINIRYPWFFKSWLFEVKKRKRSRNYLGSIDPETMLKTIKEKMSSDQLYCNPDLSLQELSDYVNLTRYQLSELLNDYAKMSFHEFVSFYRVEAAKVLLKTASWKKNISIGYKVGFNSQTMFNRTFKKWVNQTPSEYQKKYTHDK